jgi:hypothetical protein
MGDAAETAARLNAKLWSSLVMVASYRFSGTAEPTKICNFAKRFEAKL